LEVLRSQSQFWEVEPSSLHGPRLLAIGSSRIQLSFDAKLLTECFSQQNRKIQPFNFGCSAAGPITSLLNWERLKQSGCRTDAALVELHPRFLSNMEIPFEARWLHPYRLSKKEVDHIRYLGWNIDYPKQYTLAGMLTTSYCYRAAILNQLNDKFLLCPYGLATGIQSDELGYSTGHTIPIDERPRALKRAYDEYSLAFKDYQAGGTGVTAIRELIRSLESSDISVAIVLMPESSEFRSWYGQGSGTVTTLAYGLAKQFSIPLIDARTWVEDYELIDGHHPTPNGSRQFTVRLANDLISMQWPPLSGGTK
jgi:hypothetical protein